MNDRFRDNWYTFEATREITGLAPRTLRRRLSDIRSTLVRTADADGPGRAPKLYHFTALPELAAHHSSSLPSFSSLPSVQNSQSPPPISPDDLATAQLRLQAIREYTERRKLMSAERAAQATAADWGRRPREIPVHVTDRLPGNHARKHHKAVSLGSFKPRTLRAWADLYNKERAAGKPDADILPLLAPKRKGHTGRASIPIPDDLVEFMHALWSGVRADVPRVIEYARKHWPGEFPEASRMTYYRRLRAFDPHKVGKDLNLGMSAFRTRHSPDIEIDWQQLPWNGRWEIDDVTEDWYAHASEVERTIRPFAYAIIRARTRKWIAVVTSETPIVQEQVRTLVGVALSSPQGGLPDLLKFERGTVAADPYLESLLDSLGVAVSRTSMDGGAVTPGAVPDVGKGHFQGKPLVESNFRKHHTIQAMVPGQVGGEERHTAPARTENLRKLSERYAREGKRLILPGPAEWPGIIRAALEKHNAEPHSGLPEILTPEGKRRRLTPDEMEDELKAESVRVMDERLMPLFHAKGTTVPVTRNGIRINNYSYGRFDEELRTHERVTVYASADHPEVAYVHELGRCVELYRKAAPGDTDQFERKRGIEKRIRNKRDAAIQRALTRDGATMIEAVYLLGQPHPDRQVETVSNNDLLTRAQSLTRGVKAHRAARDKHAALTDFDADGPSDTHTHTTLTDKPTRRRSLVERARRFEAAGVSLSTATTQPEEDDQWNS